MLSSVISYSRVNNLSKRNKREERIRQNPNNVSLEDFEAFINIYGYIEAGAKHYKAVIGNYSMTYKRENPMKSVYVKQLLKYIDLFWERGGGHAK
jgi:hypothetical protein